MFGKIYFWTVMTILVFLMLVLIPLVPGTGIPAQLIFQSKTSPGPLSAVDYCIKLRDEKPEEFKALPRARWFCEDYYLQG